MQEQHAVPAAFLQSGGRCAFPSCAGGEGPRGLRVVAQSEDESTQLRVGSADAFLADALAFVILGLQRRTGITRLLWRGVAGHERTARNGSRCWWTASA